MKLYKGGAAKSSCLRTHRDLSDTVKEVLTASWIEALHHTPAAHREYQEASCESKSYINTSCDIDFCMHP